MSALRRLWAQRDHRPTFVAATAVLLATLAVYPVADWYLRALEITSPFSYHDFGAYRTAWNDWQAGDPLYQPDNGFHGEYLYPPVWLLLFDPFAGDVDFFRAAKAWGALSVGLTWIGLQAVAAAARLRLHVLERVLLLWILIGFHPLLYSVKIAQVSGFLVGLLTIGLAGLIYQERLAADHQRQHQHQQQHQHQHQHQHQQQHQQHHQHQHQHQHKHQHREADEHGDRHASRLAAVVSGVATTLGSTMKLIYLPAGAHLLRDRLRFSAALLTGVVLGAISIAVFGVTTNLAYLDVLLWGKGWEAGRSPFLWMPPYFRPFHVFGEYAIHVRGILLGGVIALVLAARNRDAELSTYALGLAAIPLLAPRAYTLDLVVLVPAAAALLIVQFERDGAVWLVPVALLAAHWHAYGLWAFTQLPEVWPQTLVVIEPLISLLQPGLWACLVLAGLAAVRVGETVPVLHRAGGRVRDWVWWRSR